jgi:hypothetical protein
MVAGEALSPSFASSSRRRGLPQVGFRAHILRMSWISSASFPGRPVRGRDFHPQNILNPARGQRMTVSGWKIIKASFQPGQQLFKVIQINRSLGGSLAA